jgi:hypothetical protein
LATLHATAQDTEAKLVDIHRKIGEVDAEVKAYLQKGQRERAKVALRRKKVLEKQVISVQNVRVPFDRKPPLPRMNAYFNPLLHLTAHAVHLSILYCYFQCIARLGGKLRLG